jgi:SET domain-containing protein
MTPLGRFDPDKITPFVRDVVLPCLELSDPVVAPGASPFAIAMRGSPIHRWGVFAEEPIPKNRKVIEYAGQWISPTEARRRWARPRAYLFRFDDEWIVDGAVNGNGSQYINHSCEPNLKVRRLGRHILYFSARDIQSGEELTIDYEFSPDSQRVECHCGAPRCRGAINSLPKK